MEDPRDAALEEYRAQHDPKIRDDLRAIAAEIKHAVDEGKKIGFDVGQHWRDMLATLPDQAAGQEKQDDAASDRSQ